MQVTIYFNRGSKLIKIMKKKIHFITQAGEAGIVDHYYPEEKAN
jgi:hypothetical protein